MSSICAILCGARDLYTFRLYRSNLGVVCFQGVSFSVMMERRSLDIVCKDQREYEAWTRGLEVSDFNRPFNVTLTFCIGLPFGNGGVG